MTDPILCVFVLPFFLELRTHSFTLALFNGRVTMRSLPRASYNK